jgi:hypothetical protein
MNRGLFVSGLSVAALSSLAACGTGLVAGTQGGDRKTKVYREAIGDPPLPAGTPAPGSSPAPTLQQIGSVTVHMGAPDPVDDSSSISFDWDPANGGVIGATKKYFSSVWKLDKALLGCVADDAVNAIGVAGAMATYLQANRGALASATNDLYVFAGVYLSGGATAAEFLGAAAAVLSVTDWAALCLTVGAAVFEVVRLVKCAADRIS